MEKRILLGKTPAEIQEVVEQLGLPKFTGKQLVDWLYQKRCASFDDMTNLSKSTRALLSEQYETGFHAPIKEQVSADGTKKYLFPAGEHFVEAAYIPDRERATLCVSTQVGCQMDCLFCATGKQGFQKNLSVAEILGHQKQHLKDRLGILRVFEFQSILFPQNKIVSESAGLLRQDR